MSGLTISMVKRATDTQTRDVPLHEVLRAIRTGGQHLRDQVEKIRTSFMAEMTRPGGDLQKAKRAIEPMKKALPAIMPCGVFLSREQPVADKLKKHSGMFTADFDDLGDKLPLVRKKLEKSPHVFAFFLSPSGNGLKAFFRVPADASKHPGSFRAVEKHVRDLCGVQIDESCKDISRLCFMSYDPGLYVNATAREIASLPEPEKPKPVASSRVERDSKPTKAQVREMLAVIPKRPHYHDWITVCAAVGDALPLSDAVEVLCEWSPEEASGEYAKKLASGFSEIHVGTLFHIARQHGWKPAPRVTLTNKPRAEAGDDITSLTSFEVSPYPAPLSQAAFHGLAGQFVERVLPNTEADPAALLFTFLVTFGNVIGRTAHAIADGTPHFCNLNMMLVGPTSKARKGSARWHTNRVFGCVDQEWIENCLASGLSTGEGLIAAVQDAITKTVKNKKSGKEETKVVAAGKTDKRLLVIQTEFSTALKAMEREGNTLSSVIRAAWDCEPKLRTLTKNSPTCATKPHISIIGHITAEEVRPGLSAIEAANGFGNRFLWVPVKRSKELPEGGELPAVSDLIESLQNAVESAKKRTEPLKRDEAARELWGKIYHDLSAEQPGLFGAITARSEAQCLRVSNLYALLDCSPLVGVEHLKAAFAAWRYCEDGARWVFRTGTGNKDADRILAALAATGEKGLTKWQITADVFSRNATKHEIDEALRLLHSRELAFRKMEGTTTRPAERWFYQGSGYEVYEESGVGGTPTGDTSYRSYPPASEKVSSAEPAAEAETLIGDEKGVGRL